MIAACGGGGELDSASSARLLPTVYLEDGRMVNSCSVDPRCADQVLVINGSYRQASVQRTSTGPVITTPTMTLTAPSTITCLHFADGVVALDLDVNIGQACRLYQAAFNRKPDMPGLGYWVQMMDIGAVPALNDVAHQFYHSDEFRQIYGTVPFNSDLIIRYFRNALQRESDAGGFAYWLDVLNRRLPMPAQVLAAFTESVENKARAFPDIQNGILFIRYGTEHPQPAPIPTPMSDFMWTSRSGVHGEWKTRNVRNDHELSTLAALGRSHFGLPFFSNNEGTVDEAYRQVNLGSASRSCASASNMRQSIPSLTPLLKRR